MIVNAVASTAAQGAHAVDVNTLRQRFAILNVLDFDQQNGLTRLLITAPAATATLMLQGAHLTAWQPHGQAPIIFLSRKSDMAPGKAIRGGVPLVFPWFAGDTKADRIDGHPGPSHGFARIQDWTLESAALAGQDLHLKLTLAPTAISRSMGYDSFLLTLDVHIGAALMMVFAVANTGTAPLHFEQAFHSYFNIEDIHEVQVDGLEPSSYIDKIDDRKLKPATGVPIRFTGPTDRVYRDTAAPLTIHSGSQRRSIHIGKSDSTSTVVWNPGKALPDLGEWDWHEMVAVETANVGDSARTLALGETLHMAQTVTILKL